LPLPLSYRAIATRNGAALRLAQNDKCPAVSLNFPSHKISRDELDNKLPKNIKWNKDCIPTYVRLYNDALDALRARLHSPKCDPKLTQRYFESQIKELQEIYLKDVNEACRIH